MTEKTTYKTKKTFMGKLQKTLAACGLVLLLSVSSFADKANAFPFKVIPNLKPNFKESRYRHLKEIKSINVDMGNGMYILQPSCLTVDKEGNLYIYDLSQARIFKLDKNYKYITSFGQHGNGKDQFRGIGKANLVYIHIGHDQRLYAVENRRHRVLIFSKDGKFLEEKQAGRNVAVRRRLTIDANGNAVFPVVMPNDTLKFQGYQNEKLYSLPFKKELFDFIAFLPNYLKKFEFTRMRKLQELMVLTANTLDARTLLYFQPSSTMMVLKDGKVENQFPILPADAFHSYKVGLAKEMKKHKDMFRDLFFEMFQDDDNKDAFLMQMGHNAVKDYNMLYRFSTDGKMLDVYYTRMDDMPGFTRFFLKKGNKIYGINGDAVKVFEAQ